MADPKDIARIALALEYINASPARLAELAAQAFVANNPEYAPLRLLLQSELAAVLARTAVAAPRGLFGRLFGWL